jgi:hypothetical protein
VTGGRDQMRQASDDGSGAPDRQSNTFQRGGAVHWRFRPPATDAARDLPLLKTPEGTTLRLATTRNLGNVG